MANVRHATGAGLTRRAALGATPGLLLAAAAAAAPEARAVWHDARRARDIPVLIREPAGDGPAPTVLISHGLGGSRDGLGYLGRALAEAGFLAIHLQHPGTDDSLWRAGDRTAFAAAALDVGRAVDRLQDVLFALDRLPPRADPQRLSIAGHSYGAWVVQHMLGQRIPGGARGLPLPERRLKAGVALSPIVARGLPPRLAYGGYAAPMLFVTGTADDGWLEGVRAVQRREPFEQSEVPGALAVLDGAVHASFADEPAAGARWSDPTYHERAAGLTVAFLRATLEGDARAIRFLRAAGAGLLRPGDELLTRGL
ncbi:acetylhydrolase [Roseomonas sp. OT10]|uniref:alpha/beta hydrolase family protein n=1 Tax=Roseomonas cutis TaxID=2897332 RepID=UPI001E4C6784|nr:acetylhydrolase [Roseomonas sp. OT10]UFN51270.1 acetylhydrolase [Roseomonas sp. OT10]